MQENEVEQSESNDVEIANAEQAVATEVDNVEAAGLIPLLQALLLSSSDPLSAETMAEVSGSEIELVAAALEMLIARLEDDEFGFNLVKVAKGYQLRTKPQYGHYIRSMRQDSPRRLSPASLETLAVVAYRQPVVKHDIDSIRGVDVAPTLKTLIERSLVQVVGHKDTVGHPALYGTTEEFLRIFGLDSIQNLPNAKELSNIEKDPGEDGARSFENQSCLKEETDFKEEISVENQTSEISS